jgi:DnaJ-domain-containing protein 1
MTSKSSEPWAAWVEHTQKWMGNPAAMNPFGLAMEGFAQPLGSTQGAMPLDAQALMKAIDPAEIDRRIGDMRAVEAWLKLSLTTIEMSIKTMEMQRDAYASLGKMNEAANKTARASADAMTKTMKSVKRAARSTKAKR